MVLLNRLVRPSKQFDSDQGEIVGQLRGWGVDDPRNCKYGVRGREHGETIFGGHNPRPPGHNSIRTEGNVWIS